MARGARPDIFAAQAKRGRRKESIPLTAGNINALRVFIRGT